MKLPFFIPALPLIFAALCDVPPIHLPAFKQGCILYMIPGETLENVVDHMIPSCLASFAQTSKSLETIVRMKLLKSFAREKVDKPNVLVPDLSKLLPYVDQYPSEKYLLLGFENEVDFLDQLCPRATGPTTYDVLEIRMLCKPFWTEKIIPALSYYLKRSGRLVSSDVVRRIIRTPGYDNYLPEVIANASLSNVDTLAWEALEIGYRGRVIEMLIKGSEYQEELIFLHSVLNDKNLTTSSLPKKFHLESFLVLAKFKRSDIIELLVNSKEVEVVVPTENQFDLWIKLVDLPSEDFSKIIGKLADNAQVKHFTDIASLNNVEIDELLSVETRTLYLKGCLNSEEYRTAIEKLPEETFLRFFTDVSNSWPEVAYSYLNSIPFDIENKFYLKLVRKTALGLLERRHRLSGEFMAKYLPRLSGIRFDQTCLTHFRQKEEKWIDYLNEHPGFGTDGHSRMVLDVIDYYRAGIFNNGSVSDFIESDQVFEKLRSILIQKAPEKTSFSLSIEAELDWAIKQPLRTICSLKIRRWTHLLAMRINNSYMEEDVHSITRQLMFKDYLFAAIRSHINPKTYTDAVKDQNNLVLDPTLMFTISVNFCVPPTLMSGLYEKLMKDLYALNMVIYMLHTSPGVEEYLAQFESDPKFKALSVKRVVWMIRAMPPCCFSDFLKHETVPVETAPLILEELILSKSEETILIAALDRFVDTKVQPSALKQVICSELYSDATVYRIFKYHGAFDANEVASLLDACDIERGRELKDAILTVLN